jgi:hypothetical protein
MIDLVIVGGIGLVLGYALRLYGETFGRDRCAALQPTWQHRCVLEEGHEGPHKKAFGISPGSRWWN